MAAETPPPPIVTIVFADLPCRDELEVAIRADVVVAIVALRTVESRLRRRDRLRADVALGGYRQSTISLRIPRKWLRGMLGGVGVVAH